MSVVAKVRPQVVEISTSAGLGSGVIYDDRGDIVTNDHVVGSATTFTVHLVDGQSLSGSLVGAYPPDDLAVIRVTGARSLSPATFGDSGALQVGDIVFAVGNPLGLASSVTEGIVSYNGRTVSEGNGVELPSTIQTSAAINPGNSGGALVNLDAAGSRHPDAGRRRPARRRRGSRHRLRHCVQHGATDRSPAHRHAVTSPTAAGPRWASRGRTRPTPSATRPGSSCRR